MFGRRFQRPMSSPHFSFSGQSQQWIRFPRFSPSDREIDDDDLNDDDEVTFAQEGGRGQMDGWYSDVQIKVVKGCAGRGFGSRNL